jgi:hypothetical protein
MNNWDCTSQSELKTFHTSCTNTFWKIIFLYHSSLSENAYRLLVGKPEGKRPLGRPRCRWVDNIRMELGEVGWGYVDWIGMAQDRNRWRDLVNSVLNLRVK